jgi:GT2 family glycosyltransferase
MSMMDAEVLVGIVAFNRKERLVKTLEECRRLGFADILVFDNASGDGTREYLSQQVGIRTILSEKNEGGSGGFNEVMRYFIENTACRWLLTFDDDAYPLFSYQRLVEYLHSQDGPVPPAYAFRVTYTDGSLCMMNRPSTNVLTRNPLRFIASDFHIGEHTGGCPVDCASFVGLLLKRETIQAVGIVSKKFFIYSDDIYYTLSISRDVGRLFYCPDLVITHDCGRSSRKLANHDLMRLEREVVNKIILIREYSRFKTVYIILYVARLLFMNPKLSMRILRAVQKGVATDLMPYRNEAL